jgi:hypothetical protein
LNKGFGQETFRNSCKSFFLDVVAKNNFGLVAESRELSLAFDGNCQFLEIECVFEGQVGLEIALSFRVKFNQKL